MKHVLSFTVAGACGSWVAALVAAPLVAGAWPLAAGLVYALGALICHQQPDRSFFAGGVQLPVCARCFGLYAGAALGAMGWWGWRLARASQARVPAPGPRLVALAAVPTGVTVASALTGLGDPSNVWRALLAVPLGAAAGAVVGAVASRDLK